MIADKEKLIDELEEHLMQIISCTPGNPYTCIPYYYAREAIAHDDIYGSLSIHQIRERVEIFTREVTACV